MGFVMKEVSRSQRSPISRNRPSIILLLPQMAPTFISTLAHRMVECTRLVLAKVALLVERSTCMLLLTRLKKFAGFIAKENFT